jgi:hypothetical protein
MKKSIYLLALLLCTTVLVTAQKTIKSKRTTKSKVTNKTAKSTPRVNEFSIPITLREADGSSTFYDIGNGTQLIYAVEAFGKTYDFIVTLNDYDYERGIDFNYEMTNEENTKGHVSISKKGANESIKYINYFKGGELKLTNTSSVWLSSKNFMDMPDNKTTMQMDDAAPETFYKPEKNEVLHEIKVKGETKTIQGFMINNAADGTGSKTLWIHDISANPLIIKMNLGFTIQLKEIR